MNKKEAQELTDNLVVADALLSLRAIENLLIAKGVFTREEYSKEMEGLIAQIAKDLLKSAHVAGDIDQIVKDLKEVNKKTTGN